MSGYQSGCLERMTTNGMDDGSKLEYAEAGILLCFEEFEVRIEELLRPYVVELSTIRLASQVAYKGPSKLT
jgi:hypothetical protein